MRMQAEHCDVRRVSMNLLYSDKKGTIYEHETAEPAFRTGRRFVRLDESEFIKLPYGSYMFSLPDRYPVTVNKNEKFSVFKKDEYGINSFAVSAFLASAYLRTYLPAYEKSDKSKSLPLWAYAGAAIIDNEFYVPAVRIDADVRSDPALHENHDELNEAIDRIVKLYPNNRLIKQLVVCSIQYGCLCARNFFLSRHEAPVPTSMKCNAICLGCLSHQNKASDFSASQPRLNFHPSPEEIAELILHHFNNADNPVASFGQGCEGEPLLRGDDLVRAVSLVRQKTSLGTLNINTNASKPEVIKNMIKEGLDSIRVSMNSPTPEYYNKYHQPNYEPDDVYASLDAALSAGIFVSLNLFFMPGFTDATEEVESLFRLLDKFPVSMIQTRNMNIDPDYYFDKIEFQDSEPIGIKNLLNLLEKKYPQIKLGYYNPFNKIDEVI